MRQFLFNLYSVEYNAMTRESIKLTNFLGVFWKYKHILTMMPSVLHQLFFSLWKLLGTEDSDL